MFLFFLLEDRMRFQILRNVVFFLFSKTRWKMSAIILVFQPQKLYYRQQQTFNKGVDEEYLSSGEFFQDEI